MNRNYKVFTNKGLTKEETKGLLSLIEKSNIIHNRQTNAITNKMKVEEWVRITKAFNETIGSCRRTPQQLRLKWENLKKNARKRSAIMEVDMAKPEGGPPVYVPRDDILDRVGALLSGSQVNIKELLEDDAQCHIAGGDRGEASDDGVGHDEDLSSSVTQMMQGIKRKFPKPDDGRQARNKSLAEYFNVKRKFVQYKFEKTRLENEKIELENEKIRLENEKLRLEIKKLKSED